MTIWNNVNRVLPQFNVAKTIQRKERRERRKHRKQYSTYHDKQDDSNEEGDEANGKHKYDLKAEKPTLIKTSNPAG